MSYTYLVGARMNDLMGDRLPRSGLSHSPTPKTHTSERPLLGRVGRGHVDGRERLEARQQHLRA